MQGKGCSLSRFGVLVFGLGSLLICVLIFSIFNLAPISRRLEALPLYARSYVSRVRPKPALPTPPPATTFDLETSLQTQLETASQPESQDPQVSADDPQNPGIAESMDQLATASEQGTVLVESQLTQVLPITQAVSLSGFKHEWQTWNNCGPATVSMNLSYYGHDLTQLDAASFLKPDQEDKNVSPEELADYARSQGYDAMLGQGGDLDLLKHLLSNDLPVMVEAWVKPEDNGGMGHYYLLSGYDQGQNQFLAYDSLHGPGVVLPAADFDQAWRVFNRTYLVVFPPDRTSLIYAILGPRADPNQMIQGALLTAQTEAKNQPDDPVAWFNVGTGFARLGQVDLAAGAFDQARRLGLPYRMLWYQFDIFETYLAAQRYQELVDLTTATLTATGGSEEMYYYRGQARQALGQAQAAAEDYQAALDYNPGFSPAARALADLDADD